MKGAVDGRGGGEKFRAFSEMTAPLGIFLRERN